MKLRFALAAVAAAMLAATGVASAQPAVVVLQGENIEWMEGYKRTPLGDIGANQVKKLTWVLKAGKNAVLKAGKELQGEIRQLHLD